MHCYSYYLIIHTIILSISFFHLSIAGNNVTDRLALLEIKASINDPFGALNSWNDSLHFCTWYGVTCRPPRQRVTVINLPSLELSGSISPYIGNLTYLRVLQLQNNSFSGTLPSEIGRLHRLQHLIIYINHIGGEIPSNISGCTRLIKLGLGSNKFVGNIPNAALGSLVNLQRLLLTDNNFTGKIPSSLGNLSSLNYVSMSSNKFVGSIPESFGRLKDLTMLGLSQNELSGLVPSSIFNLSRLTSLALGYNERLQGSLPLDIGVTLPLLTFLSISSNMFDGVIPTSVSNLSNLENLELSTNNFRGRIPSLKNMVNLSILLLADNSLGYARNDDLGFVSSLENSTMLSSFVIGGNNFGGMIPEIICNFSRLENLLLNTNKITGKIPSCIGNLVSLEMFIITNNHISGVIPENLGKLQHLDKLYLDRNQLSGYIPSSVGNLTKLSLLSLAGNNLVGQIPSSIGNCLNLIGADLSQNKLNGSIPAGMLSLPALSIALILAENRLTGNINSEVSQLKNIVEIAVSDNLLSGKIPASLGACVELEALYLDGNLFEGVIPDEFKTLTSLLELDLSRNNLSGKIPTLLVNLPLKRLNLSYNNFNGEIPGGGVFENATAVSFIGNSMLCGGIPGLNLHKCAKTERSETHRKRLILGTIFGTLGIIMLVMFALVTCFWNKKKTVKTPATSTDNSLLSLSYQSLLKATDGFSIENLIGSGSFGAVYKGILDPDETLVAIKIFKLENRGASKSFMAECDVLRNIRHRNLIKVITACSSLDYQGNDFKALVYEYMVNGSLDDWLHPNQAHKTLNFRQRLDIAVDVAFAMEYLHHDFGDSIIHCDLKPSNILLDNDMVAHVGDFGLAKFLAISKPLNSSTSLGLRGTVGYAPPEYGLGNEASTSGDVYSFGILLMEMVTGKRPTLEMFKDGLSLRNLVEAALPDRVTEILDVAVVEEDEVNEETKKRRNVMLEAVLISVLGLAISCSVENPRERLEMKEVASELSAIRNRFIKT